MTPLLQVEGLEIRYHTREGTLTALRNVDFDINPGEIVGVVGESGCGKSTVASSVLRLLPPNGQISAGRILFKGEDLCRLDDEGMRRLRGKEISMIFQDPLTSLNPVFTLEDQMLAAQMAHLPRRDGSDRKALRARAVQMLDRVGIPDAAQRITSYPHQLSGGMRQRVMIAMALLSHPALLVADEPTSALDVTLEAQIVDLLRGLRDELGTAILYITHDLGVVAQLCDRVLVMYAGNVVESGDVCAIFERPKHPYTRALLRSHPAQSMGAERLTTIPGRVPGLKDLPPGCLFAPRCDQARRMCHAVAPVPTQVGGQMVLCNAYRPGWEGAGDDIAPRPEFTEMLLPATSDTRPAGDEVIVEVRDLRTHFRDPIALLSQILGRKAGAVRAVDGVDIAIRRGETVALVGESGSGKTTLGRTLLRLEDSTAGEIVLEGQAITHLPQSQVRPMRARMQMIFQDPTSSLNPRMKVGALLLEPFQIHGVPVEGRAKVEELLSMVGLSSEQADKYPHQLSGGQARRVGIARALALHPDILVADEPTAGLDVSVAAGILNLLKDLREKLNLTYILITHNLNIVSFIADRVAVMYLGKVVELAGTRDLFAAPKHPYTEALMSAIPVPNPRLRDVRKRIVLQGEIPSPRTPPPGCPFHPRCRYVQDRCTRDAPPLCSLNRGERLVACHFPERAGNGA